MKTKLSLSYKQLYQLVSMACNLESEIGWTRAGSSTTAFVSLMRICRDYVEMRKRPLAKKEDMAKVLLERLDKFYTRYFEEL